MVWPHDDRTKGPSTLKESDSKTYDVHQDVYFDGTQAHQTEPFAGNRKSIVWFVANKLGAATPWVVVDLVNMGFNIPLNQRPVGHSEDLDGSIPMMPILTPQSQDCNADDDMDDTVDYTDLGSDSDDDESTPVGTHTIAHNNTPTASPQCDCCLRLR